MIARTLKPIRWVAIIAIICLMVAIGWLLRSRDNSNQEKGGLRKSKQIVATPPALTDSPPVGSAARGALPNSTITAMVAQDFAAISLKDIWATYNQPVGSDRQLRARIVKGLSYRLRRAEDGAREILMQIAERLRDESGNEGERISLARVLGESDSPDALAILIETVRSTRNSNLSRAILEQLDRMGSPETPQQVSAMANVAKASWQDIVPNENSATALYAGLGKILAKVGDPEAVRFLRMEAVLGGMTIAALDASGSDSSVAAMNASFQVRGSANVPILADALRKDDPSATEFIWSGQALVSLGRPEATSAIIEWAKVAPDSCAETAAAWIGSVRDSRSHALVRELAASGAQMQFASSLVKQAVLASADKLAKQ